MYDDASGVPQEIFEEANIECNADDMALSESLNDEQRAVFDEIMSAINDYGSLFFVDGPGVTGKTFLYKALLAKVRSQDKLAVAIATSGVAASNMLGGRTTHSHFKIPLTLEDDNYFIFKKQSGTPKLLRQVSLIIWDEAPMIKRQGVEALDNNLGDIMDRPQLPFCGKTVVLGGDFRQLVRNMRAHRDPWFADFLLRIGCGTKEVNADGEVLPDEICVPYTGDDDERLPFQFKKKQFPIRLSFAMIVNKAQVQTIPNVGVYLREPALCNGLYTGQ
nr:ATP-dependent DNA helicase PIF4-like [Setaria viridis]